MCGSPAGGDRTGDPGDLDFINLSFSSSASGNREDGTVKVLAACVEVLLGGIGRATPVTLTFLVCLSLLLLLATGRTEQSRSWPRVWKSFWGGIAERPQ